jgi:dUTP pyrophosphatase
VSLEQSDASVSIAKGDKIAQMSPFESKTSFEIQVVNELMASDRGAKGFGSSGR